MKTIHYPNTLRSHFVTIVPMAPFTPKSTSKLRSALHFSYSIVIRRFYSRSNTANPNNHYNHGHFCMSCYTCVYLNICTLKKNKKKPRFS